MLRITCPFEQKREIFTFAKQEFPFLPKRQKHQNSTG